MTDLRSTTAAKVVAVVLFVALALLAVFSFIGTIMVDEWTNQNPGVTSFDETASGQWYAQYYAGDYNEYGQPYRPGEYYFSKALFDLAYPLRNVLPYACAISSILCLALFVFLLFSAGHHQGREGISLSSVDRIPLDLLTVVVGALCVGGCVLCVELPYWGWRGSLAAILPLATAMVLLVLVLVLSFAARFKQGGWWRNTLVVSVCQLLWRLTRGLCRWFFHGVAAILENLPLLWRMVVGFGLFTLVNYLLVSEMSYGNGGAALLWLLLTALMLALLCWFCIQREKLRRGAKRLAGGNLDSHIELGQMFGSYREDAENLNRISSGMSLAVEERMKSERLKTELITNVSHDIKTPLTSIINYVDLLKREQPESETIRSYLEVLERQTGRLKKLTEDVLEASKAATGNINVELGRTNVGELLDQVVAEYEQRLSAAGLTLIINRPQEELAIMADGRLLWRVLDNLLNNICKYSQPQTRVYFSVRELNSAVEIVMKNISKELLNVSAEELQERFVRGDSARSSEGSGLGLSIAHSLTELQKGSFALDVDGDLFKAQLTFPKCLEQA